MKIEFGCGEIPTKENYLTCDVRQLPNINFVCNAWEIDKYVEENSVEEIFSRHFFEHLTFSQGEIVLLAWHKILKYNGICEMIIPNMSFHIKQWNNRSTSKEFNHAKAGFWGWQRGNIDEIWDVHKSGYDLTSLIELLTRYKFKEIKSLESQDSPHLHVVFKK